jgi:hypothetical protein
MIEIYADFNNFAEDGSLPLTCQGSIASIDALGPVLTDGEEVWLTDGELRVQARVYRSRDGWWEARGNWEDL